MTYLLLFICLLLIKTLSFDFKLSGPQTKLLTWMNKDGVQQKLLISQLSAQQNTVLVQKTTFPYEYSVDQNCQLIQSTDSAILYQSNLQKKITVQYTYMEGNQVKNKNKIQLQSAASFNLNEQYIVNLSTLPPITENLPNLSSQQTLNTTTKNLMYLFNNQTLMQIDQKIYSNQPFCYMLSRMTQNLCQQQQCMTLSPSQLYQMEIGPLIKNFSLVNNLIVLPTNSNNQLSKSIIYATLQSIDNSSQLTSANVKQEVISLSGKTKINVNFQLSQINNSINFTSTSQMKMVSSSSQYDVKITLTNQQPVYAIKTIILYKGTQQVLSDRVLFKPYLEIDYQTVWKSDQAQIPSVQIYNQQLQFQGKYSMNINVDTQQTQPAMSQQENQDIIQSDPIQEITINEIHSNHLPLIIGAASGGGAFIILLVVLWFCRKNIINKCCSSDEDQNKKQKAKEEPEYDKRQSGRQLNIQHDIQVTFQKKGSIFSQFPSTKTRDITEKKQSSQKQSNNQECSIQKDLSFSKKQSIISAFSQQIKPSSIISEIVQRQFPSQQQMSLSINSNYSKSYSKKRLTTKSNLKQKQEQEQTQNI